MRNLALPLLLVTLCLAGPAVAAPGEGCVPIVVQPTYVQQPVQPHPVTPATPDARATVKEYIRKLMDEPRVVPLSGPRGSAGSFAQLADAQVEEYVSAIIDSAALFGPPQLTDLQRWALVAVEISIESAFKPNTSGANPGDTSKRSVGPLQLTLGIWDDIMRKYCHTPLKHYDGSAWDPAQTDSSALEHSIYDNIIASMWAITEQGRRGCPDWLGGPDGPAPKTYRTAYLGWVLGCPCVRDGSDLANQRGPYISSIETDLKLLGFPIELIDTPFAPPAS